MDDERPAITLESVLTSALSATARSLESHPKPPAFKESDFENMLVAELSEDAGGNAEVKVVRQRSVRWPEWPGVGEVDVALSRGPPSKETAFVELKWGNDKWTLGNCVWDLAKMALALRKGAADSCYLAAGTSVMRWSTAPARELFDSIAHSLEQLRVDYRTLWLFWEKDVKTRPIRLPRFAETTLIASEPLTIGGADWEIRCIRVAETGSGWFDWSPLSDEKEGL